MALEDRWFFSIYGLSVPMGLSTSLTLWTIGDGTKFVSKTQYHSLVHGNLHLLHLGTPPKEASTVMFDGRLGNAI